jgi:hypothetical protein
MSDEPKKWDRKRWLWRAAWTLIALPAIYVLSSGPANWLSNRGYIDFDALMGVYDPLDTICDKNEAVSEFYSWYLRLFIKRPPPGTHLGFGGEVEPDAK